MKEKGDQTDIKCKISTQIYPSLLFSNTEVYVKLMPVNEGKRNKRGFIHLVWLAV